MKVIDEKLFQLMAIVVKDGIHRIRNHIKNGKYISGYSDWPSISRWENGLPNLHESPYSFLGKGGVPEYSNLFSAYPPHKPDIEINSITGTKELIDYCKNSPNILKAFEFEKKAVSDDIL